MSRLSLAVPTEPRNSNLDKDSLLQNAFIDTDTNTGVLYATKRPGFYVGSEAVTTGIYRGIYINPNNPSGGEDGNTQVWYIDENEELQSFYLYWACGITYDINETTLYPDNNGVMTYWFSQTDGNTCNPPSDESIYWNRQPFQPHPPEPSFKDFSFTLVVDNDSAPIDTPLGIGVSESSDVMSIEVNYNLYAYIIPPSEDPDFIGGMVLTLTDEGGTTQDNNANALSSGSYLIEVKLESNNYNLYVDSVLTLSIFSTSQTWDSQDLASFDVPPALEVSNVQYI